MAASSALGPTTTGADGNGNEFAEALLARALEGMEACHGGSKFLELGAAELQRIGQLLEELPSARAAFLAILGPEPPPGAKQASSGSERPPTTPEERAAAIALVGRFRALERGHADAMAQALFQQALRLDATCAMASYGLARHRSEAAGCRSEAIALAAMAEGRPAAAEAGDAASAAAEAADAAACFREAAAAAQLLAAEVARERHPGPGLEYDASQCLFLLDSAARRLLEGVDREPDPRARPPTGFVWALLADLAPLARTSGALAWESLARRFLVKGQGQAAVASEYLTGINLEEAPLPRFAREALAHSQVFGHPLLEPSVAAWRAQLALRLGPRLPGAPGGVPAGVGYQADDLEDAAAVALYCHFAQYCVPPVDDEAEDAVAQAALDALRDGASLEASVRDAAFVVAAMYEHVELSSASAWATEAAHSAAGLLRELLRRSVLGPLEDAAAAVQLPRAAPEAEVGQSSAVAASGEGAAANPCRAFYEEILYPPWHDGCEAIGRLPLPVAERVRRLFPHARRGDGGAASVLIAGCGSGKQIVTELRSYAGCPVVALDLAPRTVAYAQRRLRRLLSPAEFARVEFCVGDIQELRPDSFGGRTFDVVVCVGVLHHLAEPREGLRRLAALLRPGTGVLQLSTYSSLGSGAFMATARAFLRGAAATRGLFDGEGALLRCPARAEVRALRREVSRLPAGDSMRELCEEARDFATTAGVLDLFFHPLECTLTLAELGEMIQSAGLESLGVLCHNPHQDRENRHRYQEAGPWPPPGGGAGMVDLARWHEVEAQFPEAFGRMHTVFAQRPPGDAA